MQFVEVGEVVPAREGLRPKAFRVPTLIELVGEVVPAREGLRLKFSTVMLSYCIVGEVVPAREGLRQFTCVRRFNRPASERLFQQEKD